MKIGLASDHRGYKLKQQLIEELVKRNYEVEDYGTDSEESTDYPDYAFKLGENVRDKKVDFGVAICGSGIGTRKEAQVTRNDNNSNIVAFGEKTTIEDALAIVTTFINTPFSDLEKHHRRVDKITNYEENN